MKNKTPHEDKSKAERIIKLSELTKGTLLYKMAESKIKVFGFYACTLDGLKTWIEL